MPASNLHQFNELTSAQMYDILQLRELVFTFGQNCDQCDMDDVDRTAMHYTVYADNKLVAYLRAFHADGKLKLGRFAVHPDSRGKGLGREMMQDVIAYLNEQFADKIIEISGQYYLEKFFQSIGFETISDVYMDAGIQHVRMRLRK